MIEYLYEKDIVIDDADARLFHNISCEAWVPVSGKRRRACRRKGEFWRLEHTVCFVHMRSDEVAFRVVE